MTKRRKILIITIPIAIAVIILSILTIILFPRSFPKPNPSEDIYDIIVAEYSYSTEGGFITKTFDKHPDANDIYSIVKDYRFHLHFGEPFLGADRELRITAPNPHESAITIYSNGVVGVNNGWYKLYGGENAAITIIDEIISLVS